MLVLNTQLKAIIRSCYGKLNRFDELLIMKCYIYLGNKEQRTLLVVVSIENLSETQSLNILRRVYYYRNYSNYVLTQPFLAAQQP